MSSFCAQLARAESSWLEPPEDQFTAEDVRDGLNQIAQRANSLLLAFSEEFGSVEEWDEISGTITELKTLIKQLETLNEEAEELEDQSPGEIDPDYAWDNREW